MSEKENQWFQLQFCSQTLGSWKIVLMLDENTYLETPLASLPHAEALFSGRIRITCRAAGTQLAGLPQIAGSESAVLTKHLSGGTLRTAGLQIQMEDFKVQ